MNENTLKNIREALVTLLETAAKVENVFDADTSRIEGDPAAIVTPTALDPERHSTAKNREAYEFSIKLMYSLAGQSQRESELKLQDAFGEVYALLRKTHDLGEAADLLEPVSWTFGYQDRADGTWRVADMRVVATKYVDKN